MEKNIIILDENFGKDNFSLEIKSEQREAVYLCKICENLLAYKSFYYRLKKHEILVFFIIFYKAQAI